ncbi:MAG TPA: GTPase HflX [Thermoleophilia bacterium]|nr:GTPase HflX [Thermoleophilia bacterium]
MSADAPGFETGATESRPRAVVFAVMPSSHGEPGEEQPLDEIKELLRSADIDWLADVVQRRAVPSARSYLGKGKMEDLKTMVRETGATVAVCEDDLTPAQVAAVLDAVDVDVLDRTELILTVFSRHAHSLEGTLQVHLAQLEYELTRMRGKGLILSRLGAGVDMRGPGETKLEVDRRVVRKRIQTLRARIEQLAKTRRTQRARRLRSAVPLIALAGYTNAGKSTLLNALTDADVSVRDRLFETLDPTSRSYRYRDRDYVLTDTVGFIRKLPHSLVDAFASTLEETTLADVVLVVADAALEPAEIGAREQTVAEVLEMIGSRAPRILVFNKIDKIEEGRLTRLRALYPEAEFVAAARGEGLVPLQERLATFFDRALRPMRLLFPYAEAGEMHRLRGVASDVHEEHTADGVIFKARLPVSEAGRYARFLTDVQEATGPDGGSEIDEPAAADADLADDDRESPDVR